MSFWSLSIILTRYIPELNNVYKLISLHKIEVMPFSSRKLAAEPNSALIVTGSLSRSTIAGSFKIHEEGALVFLITS